MIIGIAGKARAGKDTAADIIISMQKGFGKMSFATKLKMMLVAGLELSHDQVDGALKDVIDQRYGCTPRHMMQTLGTDWGRNMINQDVWVKSFSESCNYLGENIVIPDVRMENEAEYCRTNGKLIHITGRGGIPGNHSSEYGVSIKRGDIVIDNSGSKDDLIKKIKELHINW